MAKTETVPTGKAHTFQVKRVLQITRSDSQFAPGVEALELDYKIEGLAANHVFLRVHSSQAPAVLIYERELSAAEKTSGDHKGLKWNGKTSGGPLSGGYADPVYSPYQVTLESDQGQKDSKDTKVEIKDLTLSVDATAKHRLLMTVPTRLTLVTAAVTLKKKDGSGAATPVAIKVAFDFTDPGTANLAKLDSYQYVAGRYLGKAGDAAALYWQAHPDCTATSTDGFKTKCLVEVKTSAPDLGQAKVSFLSSGVGGDDFRLNAAVMKANGSDKLASKQSPMLEVWRNIDYTQVYTMESESYIDAATTHAEIGPALETKAYVEYSRGPVHKLAANLTVKYLGLYDAAAATKMKAWPADFAPNKLETAPHQMEPTEAELADYNDATPANAVKQAAAKAAIEAKAALWVSAIVTDYTTRVSNWFAAAAVPGGNSLLAVQYYHPKLSNQGDGATHFWPAGITVNLANPGSGLNMPGSPDSATWREVQGFNRGTISVIFKNYGDATRLQIICRHEIGHATRSAFKRETFGVGDHSASGLMTFDGASNTFSNDDIEKLRGYK